LVNLSVSDPQISFIYLSIASCLIDTDYPSLSLISGQEKKGLLRIINHLPSALKAPHCGERSTAV
jgi:hypothetical protein